MYILEIIIFHRNILFKKTAVNKGFIITVAEKNPLTFSINYCIHNGYIPCGDRGGLIRASLWLGFPFINCSVTCLQSMFLLSVLMEFLFILDNLPLYC